MRLAYSTSNLVRQCEQNARVWSVGQDPGCMFTTIQDAVDAINDDPNPPVVDNRALIRIFPGYYDWDDEIDLPGNLIVQGFSKGAVQLRNDDTNYFRCTGDNVYFENLLFEGSPNAALYAINGNNRQGVHIINVDLLDNGGIARQKFFIQEGATWRVCTLQQCVVNYLGTSDFACRLTNTGPAARFVDTWVQSVFFDAFFLTAFGGSFDLRGLQDIRFWYSTIRGNNDGTPNKFNTGIRHRLGGVTGTPHCEITIPNMSGVLAGPGGVGCFGDLGTTIVLTSGMCRGAASAGTLTLQGSPFITP